MKTINDIIEKAKALKTKTLVVACAADSHVLNAVEKARQENIITAILVGDKTQIIEICQTQNINPKQYEFIDEPDDQLACEKAVKEVSQHMGYFLMKGLVSTSVILKAALNKTYGFRGKNRISHVSVMEIDSYDKLLFMSDGAMNIAPTLDEKRQIIENSVEIARRIGIDTPKVGVIGAVEKVNPKMEATVHAKALVDMNKAGNISDCIVGGPFALDNAINKEAAKHKGIKDPIAGSVDILLMPRIEAGNVFYKTMMFLAGAKSASVIAGATKPIVLTSRADSTISKFYSIALSALVTK
ncbi:MAG: bifunctional enoyl-CoA hydratase/phosphate acetyltransferase [Candidatus Izimaplasma sp.]|nr:bifunctional enoyl-CoA hydratase/phosphate acetyltransferase [Candidatus Izimaplasma bacterium]